MKKLVLTFSLLLVAMINLMAQTPKNLDYTSINIYNSKTDETIAVKNLTPEVCMRWTGVSGSAGMYTFEAEPHNPILSVSNGFMIRDLPFLEIVIPGIGNIKTGMTETEIIALLGDPDQKSERGLIHYYYGISISFRLSFEPDGKLLDIRL